MHSTTYSFVQHVDVVPRCSLNNIVRKVLAFKQVVEMEISPTERLTYVSFADQRIEQYLPDFVDLTPELDEHYLAFHKVGTLLLLYPGENRATACCQVQPEQLDGVLLHPEMGSCHMMSQYYQRLYGMTQTQPPDSLVTGGGICFLWMHRFFAGGLGPKQRQTLRSLSLPSSRWSVLKTRTEWHRRRDIGPRGKLKVTDVKIEGDTRHAKNGIGGGSVSVTMVSRMCSVTMVILVTCTPLALVAI